MPSLIPWRPFKDIEKFFEQEWLEFFEEPRERLRRWLAEEVPMIRTPRMDIYETGDSIVAEVELPGVDPKQINVEVEDDVLKLEAKAEKKKEIKEKGYYRKETGTRYFKRVITLPTQVIGEKAQAEYEDGILKITIPKAKPKEEKKKIKIKVKSKK